MRQMLLERPTQSPRQHCHAVFSAFAVAHDDSAIAKIHVLHPQPQTFQKSQTAAIKQLRHETIRRTDVGEHCAYLFACKHDWQARWPACTQSSVQTAQFLS